MANILSNLLLRPELGVDLGSFSSLLYVKGRGIAIREPTLITLNKRSGEVVAIGNEARNMVGRTPSHYEVVKPVIGGIISDFEAAELLLRKFLNRTLRQISLFGSKIVLTLPSGLTEVQEKALVDVAKNAGGQEVFLIEEPLAAALGSGIDIDKAKGILIVNFGGGKTEVAVVSLGGVVVAKNIKIGGEVLNQDIINYFKDELKLLVGEQTVEEAKTKIATAKPSNETFTTTVVRGRDLTTGLPKEHKVTSEELHEAIQSSLGRLCDTIVSVIDLTPPELLSDIYDQGVYVTGGSAQLRGLPQLIQNSTGISVNVVDDPSSVAVRGIGLVLENLSNYKRYLIKF